MSLSNEDDNNYYSDTDNTDPDQKDNLNLVQGRNGDRRAGDDTDWTFLRLIHPST